MRRKRRCCCGFLESLTPDEVILPDCSFLASLPHLKELRLNCTVAVELPLLIAALEQLRRVEDFAIEHRDLTQEELTRLVRAWPNLWRLELRGLHQLTSLHFLSASPSLISKLRILFLSDCTQIPLNELRHVELLSALEELYILAISHQRTNFHRAAHLSV